MIKNNKIYGFQTEGKIFYTKNGENVPSVLFHEFAHLYANDILEIPRVSDAEVLDDLEKTAIEILGERGVAELVDSDVRYKPLMNELFKNNDEARYDYAREVFATATGELFKKIQNNLKPDINTFPKQVKELAQKEYGDNVANKVFEVAKALSEGFKKTTKNTKVMEISKKAQEYSESDEMRKAFEEGAKWALGIKVGSSEKTEEKNVEAPTEEKPKKETATKAKKGKLKKATKKQKVEGKPQFDVGDEFDNGWIVVEYLGKNRYKLVDDEGNIFEKTETEIEEA